MKKLKIKLMNWLWKEMLHTPDTLASVDLACKKHGYKRDEMIWGLFIFNKITGDLYDTQGEIVGEVNI